MAKKRLSGAQWRKRQKQGLTSNKRGRPRGPTKLLQLYQDLTHGFFLAPDWHQDWSLDLRDRYSLSWLLSPASKARRRLIRRLRKTWPERYGEDILNERTLSRYLGTVLCAIDDPTRWGRILMQDK
jgi:hypothetical protein